MTYIGEIAQQPACVPEEMPCDEVDRLFQKTQGLKGLVVIKDAASTGLITRTNFYQKMGTRYGFNLFLKRPITLLANHAPLIVDYFASIIDVSKLAMSRREEEVYDDIIIQKEQQVFGIVSIKDLLLQVADIQANIGRYLNPLTLLPGNYIIDEKLENLFRSQSDFTMLYIDLDRFKPYNDYYGFKKGDEFLQSTATILKECGVASDSFIGHIGGDDFIVILHDFDYESYCKQVIQLFEEKIQGFYTPEHFQEKLIQGENRSGQREEFALVSISIAVVKSDINRFTSSEQLVAEASRLKKICKMQSGSCFYVEPSLVS